MIDMQTEQVISLSAAAARLPKRRAGRPTHPATLFRWASRGLRGQRLETLRIGGVTCTSVEALSRFITAINGPFSRNSTASKG